MGEKKKAAKAAHAASAADKHVQPPDLVRRLK